MDGAFACLPQAGGTHPTNSSAKLRFTQSVEFIEFFGLTQETQQAQETEEL
jgi:hypothetical protein